MRLGALSPLAAGGPTRLGGNHKLKAGMSARIHLDLRTSPTSPLSLHHRDAALPGVYAGFLIRIPLDWPAEQAALRLRPSQYVFSHDAHKSNTRRPSPLLMDAVSDAGWHY